MGGGSYQVIQLGGEAAVTWLVMKPVFPEQRYKPP